MVAQWGAVCPQPHSCGRMEEGHYWPYSVDQRQVCGVHVGKDNRGAGEAGADRSLGLW
jgi:hypothetical protein